MKIVQNNSETELNHHTDKQTSSKLDQQKIVNQTSLEQKTQISQKERRNRKLTEKTLPQGTTRSKRKQNIENHHDLEVNQEKIIKHSFHNLKYSRMLNLKKNFHFPFHQFLLIVLNHLHFQITC